MIFDAGLKNSWQDWGWGPHESQANGPIRVRFDNWGGLIFAKPDNSGDFGGVQFRVKFSCKDFDFLGLRLESNGKELPSVPLTADYCKDGSEGWGEVYVPIEQLNPDRMNVIDRVIFHARRKVGPEFVAFDKVVLTKPIARERIVYDLAKLPRTTITVECGARATRVSPYIYGFAKYSFHTEQERAAQWAIQGTVRRWGGNTSTVYNWEIGAWNTGRDWFFENHESSHKPFFEESAQHGVATALTVPIMGWVAKDTTSNSFPVSVFGPQAEHDPYRPDAGNGIDKKGKLIEPGPKTRAYREISPDFVKRWIQTLKQQETAAGKRTIWMYILDNEPMIWNETHRDAHPEPPTYDELVSRAIDYGTAVRDADPDVLIAGPAEWGWTGYMYSAKDMASGGVSTRPDRRAHGDLPVIAYYLKAMAEHEKKTGKRILDVLDLHAYPYPKGVHSANADPETAALRLRSTRMLWDAGYVDESWVKEPVNLLPRMKEWIDQYYPGRGMSIGEWNYGAEQHMSGGLAVAEVLGRYAQFGVTSAFYWVYPPVNSPAMWAFRAYRNFDGKGGQFLDWYTPSKVINDRRISTFVSRNETGDRVVAILLNLSPKEAVGASIDISSCGTPGEAQAFAYEGGSQGFVAGPVNGKDAGKLTQPLPPYSITVLDVRLDKPSEVVK